MNRHVIVVIDPEGQVDAVLGPYTIDEAERGASRANDDLGSDGFQFEAVECVPRLQDYLDETRSMLEGEE